MLTDAPRIASALCGKSPFRRALTQGTRGDMVELLSARLNEAIDLQLWSRQAHWDFRGRQFITQHELFEDMHASFSACAALLAERVLQLGGTAPGPRQPRAPRAVLMAAPAQAASDTVPVEALLPALSAFGAAIRAGVTQAGKAGDRVTAEACTTILDEMDKLRRRVAARTPE